MADLEERFGSLSRLRVPDLWAEIGDRRPGPMPRPPLGPRVVAAVVALLLAAAGFGAAAVVLLPDTGTDEAGGVTNGPIAVSVGPDQDIVLLDPLTGASTPLVRRHHAGQEASLAMAWSPDGSRLAFTDVREDGSVGVFVLDVSSGERIDVSAGLSDGDDPAWSPDGARIAFTGFGGELGTEVYVVGADGSDLHAVTEEPDDGVSGAFMPAWAPDGERIAFAVARFDAASQTESSGISVVDLRTGTTSAVTTTDAVDESPAWSPDGSRIAFLRKAIDTVSVYVTDAGGGGERRVAAAVGLGATSSPRWSPEGELVFGSFDGSTSNVGVTVADADGSANTILEDAYAASPIWSPDGSLIAFVGDDAGRPLPAVAIRVVRPDGTGQRTVAALEDVSDLAWQPILAEASPEPSVVSFPVAKANGPIYFRVGGAPLSGLIEAVEPDGSGRRVVFEEEASRMTQIAWSPDGTRMAYANPILDERGIFVADADGSDPVRLTEGVNDWWPSWSPDGTTIVFSSSRHDLSVEPCTAGVDFRCPTDIYAIGVDGSNLRRLTSHPAPEYQPVWSPEGSTIAFARTVEGTTGDTILQAPRIFAMAADGTDERQVSSGDGGSDFGPSWSADGSQLAFVAIRNEDWGVWIVDRDGSNEHQIHGGLGCCFVSDAEWSPDGELIAFAGRAEGEVAVPEDGLYVMRPDGTDARLLADAPPIGVAGEIAWRPVPLGSSLEPTLSPPSGPPTAELVDTFRVGQDVRSVAYGDGSVWVAASSADGSSRGTIVRLDPQTHAVQAEIAVEVIPTWEVGGGAMVVAGGSLWVTGGLDGPGAYDARGGGSDAAVIRIDTTTNEVEQTITLGGTVGADLAFLDGELWVLLFGDESVDHAMEVVHVDAATGEVLRRVVLQANWAHTIVGAQGHLVVYEGGGEAVNVGGHLTSIDAATGASISADNPSRYSEGGPVLWRDQVWVATETGFSRFDPASGELIVGSDELDPARFGFCCGFVEADERGIWFLGYDGRTGGSQRRLDLFDPVTGSIVELVGFDEGNPVAMALAPTGAWISNHEGTLTHVRLG